MIVYQIAAVVGLIIFMCLSSLFLMVDRMASARIRTSVLPVRTRLPSPRKERFYSLLDSIAVPDWISRVVEQKKVIWSGIGLTHQQYVALWWLVSLIGLSCGILILALEVGGRIGIGLLLAIGLSFSIAPNHYLQQRIKARTKDLERALPDFLDMLTLHVEVGLGFTAALKKVTHGVEGELGQEMDQVLRQMELGYSRREALEDLADRLPSLDVAHFVDAILISDRLGTSLARTMRIQAFMLRNRRRQRAEIQARTAPIRIIPVLVFFFLPGLLLIYLAPPIITFLWR
jgi:tight adherence protein C